MKNIKIIALIAAASVALFTGCKGTPDRGNDSETTAPAAENVEIHNFIMPEVGEKIAVINVKDFGTIKIKLFPEDAEKGVENFIGLAEREYYDELIFHRIIPNFMNQGGDPKGNGTGGKSIWGEKFEGGTDENLYHFSGAVAYANSGATSTNGSQFYIVNTPEDYVYYGGLSSFEELEAYGTYVAPNVQEAYLQHGGVPFLDGGYTVFGQVFEGMDVVRAMAQVETDENDKPLTQVMMESVEIVEYTGE
ncbi:MAG: peptidylprolyl isomerase [Oscillospiraceae bacterium]|nr:peptidylprolyl isomerase [Oscillospiraceae bacterium]